MNTLKIMKWAGISLLAWAAYWAVTTFAVSEETQMLGVQTSFIEALKNRKWSKIETMVCAGVNAIESIHKPSCFRAFLQREWRVPMHYSAGF